MKRICAFGIAVIAGLACVQPVQAGRYGGGGHSFSGGHFSGGSRGYYGGGARFNGAARYSSGAAYHNRTYIANGPRYSASTAQFRNSAYLNNRTRYNANRTTAYNSYSAAQGRYAGARGSGLSNGQRVVARHSANWHSNWSRNHDHYWHGHRCHFNNGFWFVYDPLLWYPYWGDYGYGAYYDPSYYDGAYAETPAYDENSQYSHDPYANNSHTENGARVSEVQRALAREGYYDGAVDGVMGAGTRRALRNYQRDHGLDATGGITRGVIEALRLR